MRADASFPARLCRLTGPMLIALAAAVLALPLAAAELDGRVVGVADGDTITVLARYKVQHRIRIAGIDAPERGQSFGQRARQHMADLVAGQPVRIDSDKRDRYGRLVATVWVAPPQSPCRGKPECPMTLDAGLAQVEAGYAWWYRRYASEQSAADRSRYAEAEQAARSRRLGLWRDAEPVPPWDWRAAQPAR